MAKRNKKGETYQTHAIDPAGANRDPVARLDAVPMQYPNGTQRIEYERVDRCPNPKCRSVRIRSHTPAPLVYSKVMPDRDARIAYRKCKCCSEVFPAYEKRIT